MQKFPYSNLSDYNITVERGFLPSFNPLLALPPYYAAWDNIGAQLPKLLVAGSRYLRNTVEQLPLLDHSRLLTTPELERAMIILSYIAHAYVWCDADGSGESPATTHTLPACIAVPWYNVSKRLGRLPALHFATIAQNWRLLDETQGIALGNIVMNQTFYGGVDEEWFFLIPIAMEAIGGQIINAIVQAQKAADANLPSDVAVHLSTFAACLSELTVLIHRMREWCHPTIFFIRLRPFLHGWSNLPNGLVYEGVVELAGEPQKHAGGSAAQTPLIQVIDAALEVKHNQPFLKEMRKYMQPAHVKFLTEVEEGSTIRQFVERNETHTDLVLAYNQCVEKLAEFRSSHIQLAASYILSQTHSARGTGGSSFVPFIKKVRDDTLANRINSTKPNPVV